MCPGDDKPAGDAAAEIAANMEEPRSLPGWEMAGFLYGNANGETSCGNDETLNGNEEIGTANA